MTAPSLAIARRLYARKHGVRVSDVSANLWCRPPGYRPRHSDQWRVELAMPSRAIGLTSAGASTESAALRKLCRALGWKP